MRIRSMLAAIPVLLALTSHAWAQGPAGAGASTSAWMDPAWTTRQPLQPGQVERATVWFDKQLIGEGNAYVQATAKYANSPRRALRNTIVDSLKAIANASWAQASSTLERLERDGLVARCRRYWIVNGFTCDLPQGDPSVLAQVPGIRRVFRASPRPVLPPGATPIFVDATDAASDTYKPDASRASWNALFLGISRVWTEMGLTGRGVLHVIHDFGWTFGPPTIRTTIFRNAREVPDNGVDDDGNGLIDDFHGYNFDRGNADLSTPGGGPAGRATHGDLTAAVAAGRELLDTTLIVGMAPSSQWAAVISSLGPEPAVEWAIEQGADTYSMSFSIPNLGELRAHWRKVMDHGALAGLFFVSGAGNFADPNSPAYVPIPVQMRVPEDVPFSVFGVSGVGRNGKRPVFSSQGPVMWQTDAYKDGEVQKPDLATINTNITAMDPEGKASYPGANGWSGNSFAGPHLAGVMALMLEADPDLTPWRARDILVRTARDIDPPGVDMQTGAGVVDAYAAVQAVIRAKQGRLP